MLLTNCTRILVLTKTRHWSSRRGISAGRDDVVDSGQSHSGAGRSSLASFELIDHSQTLIPQNASEQRGRESLSLKTSHQSRPGPFCHRLWRSPIRSVRSIIMYGVLRCVVRVSAWAARLAASFGFGGQYITIAVRSSCQFRSLMAPSLPCNFGVECSYTFRNFHILLVHEDGHSRRHVRESRVAPTPSHLEVPAEVSSAGFVHGPSQTQWNGRRVSVKPMMCALISSLMSLILYS